MRSVALEHLERAYRVLIRVNSRGKVCTHQNFSKEAKEYYQAEVEKYPHLLVLLDRALRKLPEKHLDVRRIGHGKYVAAQFEKHCEEHARSIRELGYT